MDPEMNSGWRQESLLVMTKNSCHSREIGNPEIVVIARHEAIQIVTAVDRHVVVTPRDDKEKMSLRAVAWQYRSHARRVDPEMNSGWRKYLSFPWKRESRKRRHCEKRSNPEVRSKEWILKQVQDDEKWIQDDDRKHSSRWRKAIILPTLTQRNHDWIRKNISGKKVARKSIEL